LQFKFYKNTKVRFPQLPALVNDSRAIIYAGKTKNFEIEATAIAQQY